MQPKLFQNCLNWTKKSKRFSNLNYVQSIVFYPETATKLLLNAQNAKSIPLLSRNLKLENPRTKLIPHKCPILKNTQSNLFQNCVNWENREKNIF